VKAYINKWAAVIGLHEDGFTEDFSFSGNNLLWVQQKVLLLPEDITVMEFYRFVNTAGNEMHIFAIIANYFCVKGILITHQKNCANINMPIINTKLIKANSIQLQNKYAGVL
jgi:hypothetical protein